MKVKGVMAEQFLKPKQRNQVKVYVSEAVSETLRRRAQILLLYDEGRSTREVAQVVGLSPRRTRYWRRQFRLRGMEVFPPLQTDELHLHPGMSSVVEPPESLAEAVENNFALTGLDAALETSDVFLHTQELLPQDQATQQHIEHVRSLALTLFDKTQSFHGLRQEERRLLDVAVQLVNAEYFKNRKKNRSHASLRDWVATSEGKFISTKDTDTGLSIHEREMLAAVLGLLQGKRKGGGIGMLELSGAQQQAIQTLAAIVLVADSLDASCSQETIIKQVKPVSGNLWIVVDGPKASADALAAQKRTKKWEAIGYPRMKVMESSAAKSEFAKYPPLPHPLDEVGMQPDDSMAEAGRKAMLFHFAEMLSHEEGTRLGDDIEELHDMRVATRRMRAAFEIFGDAFDPKVLKPHLKGLRATGRALGSVRDLDVFMEKAGHYLESLPEEQRSGLDPLLDAWRAKREASRSEMLAHLDSPQYQAFIQNFNLFLHAFGAGVRPHLDEHPTPKLVREVAPVLIYTRFASVRAYDAILKNAPIEQLHALRIEFKKLRYAVEFFREVLGEESKEVIADLKRLQDHLGDLNDAEVATQILREFLDEWEPQQSALPINERQNPEGIVTYLAARHSERYRLMVSFQDIWAQFNRPEFRRNLALAISVL